MSQDKVSGWASLVRSSAPRAGGPSPSPRPPSNNDVSGLGHKFVITQYLPRLHTSDISTYLATSPRQNSSLIAVHVCDDSCNEYVNETSWSALSPLPALHVQAVDSVTRPVEEAVRLYHSTPSAGSLVVITLSQSRRPTPSLRVSLLIDGSEWLHLANPNGHIEHITPLVRRRVRHISALLRQHEGGASQGLFIRLRSFKVGRPAPHNLHSPTRTRSDSAESKTSSTSDSSQFTARSDDSSGSVDVDKRHDRVLPLGFLELVLAGQSKQHFLILFLLPEAAPRLASSVQPIIPAIGFDSLGLESQWNVRFPRDLSRDVDELIRISGPSAALFSPSNDELPSQRAHNSSVPPFLCRVLAPSTRASSGAVDQSPVYGLVAKVNGICAFISTSTASAYVSPHTNAHEIMTVNGTVLNLDPELHYYIIPPPCGLLIVGVAGQFDGAVDIDILQGCAGDLEQSTSGATLHTYAYQDGVEHKQSDGWIPVLGAWTNKTMQTGSVMDQSAAVSFRSPLDGFGHVLFAQPSPAVPLGVYNGRGLACCFGPKTTTVLAHLLQKFSSVQALYNAMPLYSMRQIDHRVFGLGVCRIAHGAEVMDQLDVFLTTEDEVLTEQDKLQLKRRLAQRFGLSSADYHISFQRHAQQEMSLLNSAEHSCCSRVSSTPSIPFPASETASSSVGGQSALTAGTSTLQGNTLSLSAQDHKAPGVVSFFFQLEVEETKQDDSVVATRPTSPASVDESPHSSPCPPADILSPSPGEQPAREPVFRLLSNFHVLYPPDTALTLADDKHIGAAAEQYQGMNSAKAPRAVDIYAPCKESRRDEVVAVGRLGLCIFQASSSGSHEEDPIGALLLGSTAEQYLDVGISTPVIGEPPGLKLIIECTYDKLQQLLAGVAKGSKTYTWVARRPQPLQGRISNMHHSFETTPWENRGRAATHTDVGKKVFKKRLFFCKGMVRIKPDAESERAQPGDCGSLVLCKQEGSDAYFPVGIHVFSIAGHSVAMDILPVLKWVREAVRSGEAGVLSAHGPVFRLFHRNIPENVATNTHRLDASLPAHFV